MEINGSSTFFINETTLELDSSYANLERDTLTASNANYFAMNNGGVEIILTE